jgi:hypothetical protein
VEEKEGEEPPERSLEAPQEEAAAEAGPAKAGVAGFNSALAMKPPLLSISLVTKLPLAHGCLYIWVTLPIPKTEMN